MATGGGVGKVGGSVSGPDDRRRSSEIDRGFLRDGSGSIYSARANGLYRASDEGVAFARASLLPLPPLSEDAQPGSETCPHVCRARRRRASGPIPGNVGPWDRRSSRLCPEKQSFRRWASGREAWRKCPLGAAGPSRRRVRGRPRMDTPQAPQIPHTGLPHVSQVHPRALQPHRDEYSRGVGLPERLHSDAPRAEPRHHPAATAGSRSRCPCLSRLLGRPRRHGVRAGVGLPSGRCRQRPAARHAAAVPLPAGSAWHCPAVCHKPSLLLRAGPRRRTPGQPARWRLSAGGRGGRIAAAWRGSCRW